MARRTVDAANLSANVQFMRHCRNPEHGREACKIRKAEVVYLAQRFSGIRVSQRST